ncbi:hypothetical protein O181_061678 [Austropuccinia psidii MF-1]|uniref:Uncharacterized protein n=1 Tax=Austropuccinia psidii MF-1 TaxID=1389203 RepID=A0A9Q3HYT0_9BASI|nr:hypothetical protein [Austropuccinia psidii MF-1]
MSATKICLLLALICVSLRVDCSPHKAQVVDISTLKESQEALEGSDMRVGGKEAYGTSWVENPSSLPDPQKGDDKQNILNMERTGPDPSKPEVKQEAKRGWKALKGLKERYASAKEAAAKFRQKFLERLKFMSSELNHLKVYFNAVCVWTARWRNAFKREPTKPLKESLTNLRKRANDRSGAEFKAWANTYAEIMKVEEFQLQHLGLESEMEHGLNDLQTQASYYLNYKLIFTKKMKPLADLQFKLQSRRESYKNSGYLSRVEHEVKDIPWALEILWPHGKLLDNPGPETLREWFKSLDDPIYEKYQILMDAETRYYTQKFIQNLEKLKKLAAKTSIATTSKQKTAAIMLLAYAYESTKDVRGLKIPHTTTLATQKMVEKMAYDTISTFGPNFQRIRNEVEGEVLRPPPKELDLTFLNADTSYNELGPELKKQFDDFKIQFDGAVKAESPKRVHKQVKVIENSLKALQQQPAQRHPAEFRAWAEIYTQIMIGPGSKDGSNQLLKHLKLEVAMQYGLLNLRSLANGPLTELQAQLAQRLESNSKNGWISRFQSELDDNPWDMEILWPSGRLLDYPGKEKLEEWFQLDPLIKPKFVFLASQRSQDDLERFKDVIDLLETEAKENNHKTSVEQKTAAIGLMSYAYESVENQAGGLLISPMEANWLQHKFQTYGMAQKSQFLDKNNQRLRRELLNVKIPYQDHSHHPEIPSP